MIALSWSRLSTYEQCPRKFKLSYIDKVFKEEEKSIHLVKGEQLHKQMEEYVLARNGRGTMPLGFSPEVKQTLPYVDKLYEHFDGVYPEAQVAATVTWSPTEWFGKDVAWRAIWDATALSNNTCFLVDWKSGKVYPLNDGFGQLHLSAVMAMNRWPELPETRAAYVYLEHKRVQKVHIVREPGQLDAEGRPIPHLAEVQADFERRFEKVQREKAWAPQPNENCKWCPATRAQCPMSRRL